MTDTVSEGVKPRRGRPPRTSEDAIAAAVLELGFGAATTAAVAERLGVDQSTLYGYFPHRAAMLAAAAELAVQHVEWPAPGDDWRGYLTACTERMWQVMEHNRGLATYIRSVEWVPTGLGALAGEVASDLTVRLGMPVREAAIIVDTLGDLVLDSYLTLERLQATAQHAESVLAATAEPGPPPTVADGVRRQLDAAEAGSAAPLGYFDAVRTALDDSTTWWREKVALVLDGVEHRWGRAED